MKNNKSEYQNESAIGISQILLGVLVIVVASVSAQYIVYLLGAVLVIRGGLDILRAFRTSPQSNTRLIVGIVSLGVGILLLVWPAIGAKAFSVILAILFLLGGIQKIISPLTEKRPADAFSVLMGVVSLLLGILIFTLWPINNFNFLGILTGIEIMINGMTITLARGVARGWGRGYKESPQH